MVGSDLNIGALTGQTAGNQRLVDHDLAVRQSDTLSLCTGRQQECTHRSSHTDANGRNIALDILHGVVDCHAGSDRTAGAVDVQRNILLIVLSFQIQQLCNYQTGSCIVDLIGQHDDTIIQQAGKNIIGTFTAAGLFYNVRY